MSKIYFSPLLWAEKKDENNVAGKSDLETIQLFAPFSCLFDWKTAICKKIVLSYKMAEKRNEEANSQSSQLDEEDLQKLVGDACGSSMADGEVNVNLSSSSETRSV